MEDRTFSTNSHPTDGISDTFREYIEALVEEVVINGEPFEAQKKWLRKNCEAEGVSYETIESNLNNLFEAIKELERNESKVIERSVKALAKDCYLSEDLVNKLIDNAAAVRVQKEPPKFTGHKVSEEPERMAHEGTGRKAKDKTVVSLKTEKSESLEMIPDLDSPYRIDKGIIYGTAKLKGRVTLPSSINEETVIGIGNRAFEHNPELESIVIPDTVTSIGVSAFERCVGMKVAVMPMSVTTLNESAFMSCKKLIRVGLSNHLQSIAARAFYGCSSLKEVDIPEPVNSIGREAFLGCGLVTVSLPDTVTLLEDNAFFNCKDLTSATLSSQLVQIGNYAFGNCQKLRSLTIPNSVRILGRGILLGCTNLKDLTVGRQNYETLKNDFLPASTTIHLID